MLEVVVVVVVYHYVYSIYELNTLGTKRETWSGKNMEMLQKKYIGLGLIDEVYVVTEMFQILSYCENLCANIKCNVR